MGRPSLDDIFAEHDEFGLLDLKQRSARSGSTTDRGIMVLLDVTRFVEQNSRLPDPDALGHDEMKLAITWQAVKASPTEKMRAADRLGLLDEKSITPTRGRMMYPRKPSQKALMISLTMMIWMLIPR